MRRIEAGGIGLAVVVLLLLAAYLAAGWYFSNIAIAPPARSLEDAQAQPRGAERGDGGDT